MADHDRLLNVEEAGRLLGLKPATVRRLTAAGELPLVRPTGRRAVRYRLSDLEALLRARSEPPRRSAARLGNTP
jgi:excisionase family DNA binding protein